MSSRYYRAGHDYASPSVVAVSIAAAWAVNRELSIYTYTLVPFGTTLGSIWFPLSSFENTLEAYGTAGVDFGSFL